MVGIALNAAGVCLCVVGKNVIAFGGLSAVIRRVCLSLSLTVFCFFVFFLFFEG